MWIDKYFIVPAAVVAVKTWGQKQKKGYVTSRGSIIYLNSGQSITTRLPTTQVVAMLGLVKSK